MNLSREENSQVLPSRQDKLQDREMRQIGNTTDLAAVNTNEQICSIFY